MAWVSLVTPPDGDGARPAPDSLWWGVQGARVVVGQSGELPIGESPEDAGFVPDLDDLIEIFLGVLDGQECWATEVDRTVGIPEGFVLQDLRTVHGLIGEPKWSIAGRAVQLVDWYRSHVYCGRCGAETDLAPGERARKCGRCNSLAFPRIAPAVITLVTRNAGEEALLARGVTFGVPMYSCLAGFVEPGETLEECVAREVREEVGIEVDNVRYQASQPWPFPHSLMLGFRAEWKSGDIVCDPKEIVDANWYRRDELPMIPPGVSIARRLIDDWVNG